MNDNTRRQMFAILSSSAEAADAALEDLRAVRDAIEVKVKAAIARANSAHRKLAEFEKEIASQACHSRQPITTGAQCAIKQGERNEV